MNPKTLGNTLVSAAADQKSAAALAEALETRSREYLQHCLKTSPELDRHTVWSRLYAVTQRLKQAVLSGGRESVADAVIEIGSNLLGCEEMAVLTLHGIGSPPVIVSSVGLTAVSRQTLKASGSSIAKEIRRGQVRIVDKRVPGDEFLSSVGITALVPLAQGHIAEGAIVFFSLLPQRQGFDSRDREILGLLAAYGPSLFSLECTIGSARP
jgi:hypothetical protein